MSGTDFYVLDNGKGPQGAALLPHAGPFRHRLGALEAVYTEALEYAKSRTTFGAPIASRQLVQEKLVRMAADHTKGLLLARLKDAGALKPAQVSLGKRDNVRAALTGARAAREILGGSGITLEYHAIRHMLNLKTIDTYEGTHDIHTLILGRELTGENALGESPKKAALGFREKRGCGRAVIPRFF